MICISTAIICLACLAFVGLSKVAGAIGRMSNSIDRVANEIHVHAETLNEIKHDGIGIDKNMTPGEKVLSDIKRGIMK